MLVLTLCWYFLTAAVALLLGGAAFVWKTLEIAYQYNNNESRVMLWLTIVGFLNQILSIIDIEDAYQDRLFLFIFGGEDGVLQSHEIKRRQTYMARIMAVIWEAFVQRADTSRRMLAISLMVSFNHFDLQKLVICHKAQGTDTADRASPWVSLDVEPMGVVAEP